MSYQKVLLKRYCELLGLGWKSWRVVAKIHCLEYSLIGGTLHLPLWLGSMWGSDAHEGDHNPAFICYHN